MKRPLVCALIFLVAGILGGEYASGGFAALLFLGSAALACVALYIKTKWAAVFVFFGFAMMGFVLVQHNLAVRDANLEALAQAERFGEFTGIVQRTGTTRSGRQSIVVRLSAARLGDMAFETRQNIIAYLPEGETVAAGQTVSLRGRIEPLSHRRNPGGFDEFLHNKSRGIEYKMFPDMVETGGVVHSVTSVLATVQSRLAHVYQTALPEREAALLQSMILGDRSALDAELAQLYRLGGIFHIICISGVHISIIALFLHKLFGLGLSKRVRSVLIIVILLLYCILTGASVSTVRAVVMCAVLVGATLMFKNRDVLTSISFAAICLLLFQPLYLWHVGFQYSFSAVYGLVILTEPLEYGFIRLQKRLPVLQPLFGLPIYGKYMSGCLAAALATLPVMMAHFHYALPYAVVVNLLVVPTIAVTTISGFAVGLLGLFSNEAAVFAAGIPFTLLRFYEFLCRIFVTLPGAMITTGTISAFTAAGLYGLMGVLAILLRARQQERLKWKRIFIGASAAFAMYVLVLAAIPQTPSFTLLDVGQGDSMVLRHGRTTFVVDGGGVFGREIGTNVGTTVLAPYLSHGGVSRVNAAFVSHTHADHVVGIIELLDIKRVDMLFLPFGAPHEDAELYHILLETAARNDVPVITLQRGDVVEMGGLRVECLHPSADSFGHVNNMSLLLRVSVGDTSFLLTGDLYIAAETAIIENGICVSADVLKLGHHGSRTSSSEAFLQRVAPSLSVVSTGQRNMFGHPHREVTDRLAEMGIPLLNTANDGAVRLRTNGTTIWQENWRRERHR